MLPTIFAALTPEPNGDVFAWVLENGKFIVESFQKGELGPAVAGLIMISVYFLNLVLKDRIPAAALPWLSAGMGVLSAVAVQLAALAAGVPAGSWLTAVLKGAMAGAAASGLWSLLGKKVVELLGKLGKKAEPAPAPTEPPTPGV